MFCQQFTSGPSSAMVSVLVLSLLLAIGHEAASVSPILTDEESFTSSEYYSSVEMESITPPPPAVRLDFVYHNYTALTDFLRNVSVHYPGLTHLYSIGKSVLSKNLTVFKSYEIAKQM